MIPFELFSLYMLRISQTIEQLPQSDGLYIFQYSPIAYAAAASFAVALALILALTSSTPIFVAVLISIVCGLAVWLKFFLEGN
jgi:dolichyl-phosphate-mannose--protein O-mannosyl transferase